MAVGNWSPEKEKEKKHWWLSNKKIVEKYVREAKILMASAEEKDFRAALGLLETALAAAPRMEVVVEMKARCLLGLRRFKEVVDLLYESVPSFKTAVSDEVSEEEEASIESSSVKLLSSGEKEFKCFSIKDLTKKMVSGMSKNMEKERQWRYLVLGQACCHLGLMEDAMVLLQTGKLLAAAAFRRESVSLPDDIFSSNKFPLCSDNFQKPPPETENISHLLCNIKLLVRRKTAATAALNAGLFSEAIRHFSKILDSRRVVPQAFLAECYVHRASAYHSAGRIADAIADCNKALALDTSCIEALTLRATLFERIKCFPDSLHDLEHLKLLYNSILRDRNLHCPIWKRRTLHYREIPGKLCSLASKIQQLKQRVAAGEIGNVDFYSLMGLKKNCSKSELERSHLLLTLKHKPEKSSAFIERCEFSDANASDSVGDRAKLSALLLYRLIQKGYNSLMARILEEEETEKQRKNSAPPAAAVATITGVKVNKTPITTPAPSVYKGIFCRDLAVVGHLLSQAGFNRPIPLKYEALSW